MLLLMPSIPAIQEKNFEASHKPTIVPIIKFESFISFDIDTSELDTPIPPGNVVILPINIKYWTDIPRFFHFIPWILRNPFLFGTIYYPVQEIHFDSSDPNNDIYVQFSRNTVFADILFSGKKSESSNDMIISIGENAPSDIYRIDIDASCYDIGRIDGSTHVITIEFTVGN